MSGERVLSAARGQQVQRIVEVLRAEIIAGRLRPETQLRQEALAARFGVSRMPVREALRELENQGFVIFPANHSARVAPLLVEEMIEIFEMRALAEPLALEKAIPRMTERDIDRAEDLASELEMAPVGEFARLNNAFHMALYRPCGRPRLLTHIESLGRAADRYLRATAAGLDYRGPSDLEHRAILKACRVRDRELAVELVKRHILDGCETMKQAMGRGPEQEVVEPRT